MSAYGRQNTINRVLESLSCHVGRLEDELEDKYEDNDPSNADIGESDDPRYIETKGKHVLIKDIYEDLNKEIKNFREQKERKNSSKDSAKRLKKRHEEQKIKIQELNTEIEKLTEKIQESQENTAELTEKNEELKRHTERYVTVDELNNNRKKNLIINKATQKFFFDVAKKNFNQTFKKLSPALSIQRDFYRFQESTKLTKSEQLLSDLRKAFNDKEDMFVDVMHRLHQRSHILGLKAAQSDQYAKNKKDAFDNLINQMKEQAQETNPMVYYRVIVEWEGQDNNKETIKKPRGCSFFQPRSVDMLENLKKDLLNQALKNGDIKLEQKNLLRDAMKVNNNQAELTELEEIFPDQVSEQINSI